MVNLRPLRSQQPSEGFNSQAYDEFIQILRAQQIWNIADVIEQVLQQSKAMSIPDKLLQIDQLKGWLDGFRPLPAAVAAEFKKLYDVRFTYNSNAIEGNTLTQHETALVLETGITIGGKTLKEHLEVIGHKEAIDYVEALAQRGASIGEWEVKQIHALVLRKIVPDEAGRYRQLDVKSAGTEYVYPPHYQLTELMAQFIEWLNSEAALKLHPVVYATEAHYRFVSIHPFRDGNGRTGRLLMNLLMLQAGYPILVISNQLRKQYIDALIKGQQTDDDFRELLALVVESTQQSLIEMLQILATAKASRGKGLPFYQDMLEYFKRKGFR